MGAIPDYESALDLIRELDAQLAAANATIENLKSNYGATLERERILLEQLNRGMDDSRAAARKAQ